MGSGAKRQTPLPPPRWLIGAVGLLAFFSPFLFGFAFFFGDFHHVFEPLRHVLGGELRRGNLLFTERLASGEPILANPFQAALYPPNLLLAIPGVRVASLLSALAIAHLFWGALGAGLLARARGATGEAAVLAAAVAGLSGLPFSSVSYVLLQATASWIPWVLLCASGVGRSVERGARLRYTGGLSVCTACLVLAGDPFMIAAGAMLLGLFSVFTLSDGGGDMVPTWVRVSLTAAGAATALLVTSPVLVAAARALAASQRAAPLAEWFTWSLHPAELLGFVIPLPFGDPTRLGPDGYLAAALTDGRPPLFNGLYVGALPLAFAAVGATRRTGSWRAPVLGLVLLTLLALGHHTPLLEGFVRLFPALRSGRYPAKWIAVAPLCLGLLCASGLDTLRGDMARSLRVCLLAFALPSAALLGAWLVPARWMAAVGAGSEIAQAGGAEGAGAIAPLLRAHVAASAARGAAIPLAAALAVLLLRSRRPAILLIAVNGLVLLDEALLALPLAPTVDATLYDRVPRAVRVILSDRPPAGRVWIDESLEAFSVRTLVQPGMRFVSDGFLLQRERLKQNIALAYGLSTAFAGDIERFAPVPYTVLRHLVEAFGPRERDLLLSASAVTHVVSVLDRTGPGLELLARLDIGAERPLSIYRNTRAYARIRMVSALLIYQDAIQLQSALRTGDDRLLADAALVDASTLGPGLRSLPGRPGPAGTHILSPLPESAAPRWEIRVLEDRGPVLQVETAGPAGFLLVADSYTPGWAARVDGRPQQILLANVAFRAVPVPAGRHLVSLTYDPWSHR